MSNELALKAVWGTECDTVDVLAERYQELYGIPEIEGKFVLPPEHLDRETDISFVLAAIFAPDGQFLILASSGDPHARLPGRALGATDTPESAAAELVREHLGRYQGELTPIVIVWNEFVSNDRQVKRRHFGIAFRAQLTESPTVLTSSAFFTRSVPEFMYLQNRQVLDLAIQMPRVDIPVAEAIEENTKSIAGVLHNCLIRPITSPFSSNVIYRKLAQMLQAVTPSATILDVACGDDTLSLRLGREIGADLVVANDIAWQSTERIRKQVSQAGVDVLVSNHNLVNLPFKSRFDIGIIKNVLHHIPGVKEADAFLRRLQPTARTLAIVEYEDPRLSLRGRAWNRYYERWLGDGDIHSHHFLTETQLRHVLRTLPEAKVRSERVATIKGTCIVATVSFAY